VRWRTLLIDKDLYLFWQVKFGEFQPVFAANNYV